MIAMKKYSLIFLFLAVSIAGQRAFGAEEIPQPAKFSRYQAMMNRSPFAVATAAAPTPVLASFAKDLYIANAARLPDEGVVTLTSSTDKNMKEYLSTKHPNANGYSISNIEWSDQVGATKVTISKGGQFATLTFNQALLSQPLPGNPLAQQIQPQPQPVQPFVAQQGGTQPGQVFMPNPAKPTAVRPPPIPSLPTPPPRVRGVIQRNPVVVPAPTPDQDLEEE